MTNTMPPLTAVPAIELDDDALRRELAATHQLQVLIEQRGREREQESLSLRLAELDAEYLRRFPQAAEKWPWPLPEGVSLEGTSLEAAEDVSIS